MGPEKGDPLSNLHRGTVCAAAALSVPAKFSSELLYLLPCPSLITDQLTLKMQLLSSLNHPYSSLWASD